MQFPLFIQEFVVPWSSLFSKEEGQAFLQTVSWNRNISKKFMSQIFNSISLSLS